MAIYPLSVQSTNKKNEFVVKGIKESGKHAWYEDDEH